MCCNAGRVFSLGNVDGGPAWQRGDGTSWERLKLAIVISGAISKSQRRHIDRAAKSWAIHCLHLGPCRTGRAGRPRGEYILERGVVTRYLERRGSEFFAGNLVEIWRGRGKGRGERERQRGGREWERDLQTGSGTVMKNPNQEMRWDGRVGSPDGKSWRWWAAGSGPWKLQLAGTTYLPGRPSVARRRDVDSAGRTGALLASMMNTHARHRETPKIEDIGRTRDAADWQKLPDAKARKGVSFTRRFSRRHCTRHLDSIPPSKPRSLISTGWRRCYIRRTLQGEQSPDGQQQPLGQLVCVGASLAAESGCDGGGEGTGGRGSPVPQVPEFHQWPSASSLGMMLCSRLAMH